jgi:hypothetical protein
MKINEIFRDRLSISWLFLIVSLTLHVIDEALNNFLDFYNPLGLKIKEHISFIPLPTFTFRIWISGLSIGVVLLLLMTPFIYDRNRFFIPVAKIFSILMILNGLAHIIGSIYYDRILPGLFSSPILIIFSAYFILVLILNKKESQIHLNSNSDQIEKN